MAYARLNGFIVLTNDLDFGNLLAWSGEDQPTVVQIRAQYLRVDAVGQQVRQALEQIVDLQAPGALVTVQEQRNRVRILPFPGWHGGRES